MGILKKVKNRYLVNRNILWIINMVMLCLTAIQCLALTIQNLVVIFGFDKSDVYTDYYTFVVIRGMCVVVNFLAVFLNRKYINTPVSILSIVIMSAVIVTLMCDVNQLWQLWVVPFFSTVICIIDTTLQFSREKEKESLVKVAKVKLNINFQPEDMINDYKKSLKAIEDKYNMGADDRESFEREKENLMQDMHQVLKEFVSSSDVSLIYKLETLYQAKKECIIPEDNYLLLKNLIISDSSSVNDVHYTNEKLLREGQITNTEYNHREELIKNEL